MWGELVYVGLGSMVGGMARHAVGCWFPAATGRVPLATLAVNVGGCFVIGLANALLARHGQPSAALRLLLTTGFCGGFTTFSTFVNENFLLLRGNHLGIALAYLILSLGLGFLALYAGYQLGR